MWHGWLRTATVLVDDVEIDDNGSAAYLGLLVRGDQSGLHANGVTVRNSDVHDNIGNGVWCDVQCG